MSIVNKNKKCYKSLQSTEVALRLKIREKDQEIENQNARISELIVQIEKYQVNDQYVRALIHELKNINRDLKFDTDELDFDDMSVDNKNLWAQSNLLSIVMNTYGYQYNQEADKKTFKRPIALYKKVDKLRRCYSYRKNSYLNIRISGSSVMTFQSTDIIEVLFFILIENARKYSLSNEDLYITFSEDYNNIYIEFKNKCELPSKEDLNHITELNYRGVNKTKDGDGIGLATFASICKANEIEYAFDIDEVETSIGRIPIGYFIVKLVFHNCQPPKDY